MHSDSTSSAPYVASFSSLDQVLYQLHTVSFFLSPALVPYLFRVLFQFQFARPREIDPERSLRFWFFLAFVFNFGSLWTHATQNPGETGNSILLDFVGPASVPSKLHLLLLDFIIIALEMLLAAIAYETALYEASPKGTEDPLLPIPPETTPSLTPSPSSPLSPNSDSDPTLSSTYAYPPKPPSQPSADAPYVMDVRLSAIYRRLRNPTPAAPERAARAPGENLLPLPNTTPSELTGTLRMILQVRARTRDRQRQAEERRRERQMRNTTTGSRQGGRRTLPGALDVDADDTDDEGPRS
ncbi:hypothetical protein EIP86_003331 [Pleurotus ostreatoroseus]|nr:hypothetical protein EIP86_003331 [Pleurotus ostreatoroseus]